MTIDFTNLKETYAAINEEVAWLLNDDAAHHLQPAHYRIAVHPDDWQNMLDALDPDGESEAWRQRHNVAKPAPTDGEEVGRIHGQPVYVLDAVPRGEFWTRRSTEPSPTWDDDAPAPEPAETSLTERVRIARAQAQDPIPNVLRLPSNELRAVDVIAQAVKDLGWHGDSYSPDEIAIEIVEDLTIAGLIPKTPRLIGGTW